MSYNKIWTNIEFEVQVTGYCTLGSSKINTGNPDTYDEGCMSIAEDVGFWLVFSNGRKLDVTDMVSKIEREYLTDLLLID